MDAETYIQALEARIAALEEKLARFSVEERDGNVYFSNCPVENLSISEVRNVGISSSPIGDAHLRECSVTAEHCPIGAGITADIENAEDMLDELESRLADLRDEIEALSDELDCADE